MLGTPGSGKTEAIVTLLRILAKRGKKVLVVAFTNQAVDNVLNRLDQTGFTEWVRITSKLDTVDARLHHKTKTAKMFASHREIKDCVEGNLVFGATCL